MKTLKEKLKRIYDAKGCTDLTDVNGAIEDVKELVKEYDWTPALRTRFEKLSNKKEQLGGKRERIALTTKELYLIGLKDIKKVQLTTTEARCLLSKVNNSNKYSKLKTLYQYVRGNWITQQQFCELLETVFGLKI